MPTSDAGKPPLPTPGEGGGAGVAGRVEVTPTVLYSTLMRRDLGKLEGREFDVLVVGGGIYGAAAFREASLRGLSAALIEQQDFAAATSANSLKIIHGGLRYLQQADLPRSASRSANAA